MIEMKISGAHDGKKYKMMSKLWRFFLFAYKIGGETLYGDGGAI